MMLLNDWVELVLYLIIVNRTAWYLSARSSSVLGYWSGALQWFPLMQVILRDVYVDGHRVLDKMICTWMLA
jgi:hypothetical protein